MSNYPYGIISRSVLAVVLFMSSLAANAALVSLVPTAAGVMPGQSFTLDVVSFGNSDSVGGDLVLNWGGDLTLDLIDHADTTPDAYSGVWDPGFSLQSIGAGTATFSVGIFAFPGPSGNLNAARLTFTAGPTFSGSTITLTGDWYDAGLTDVVNSSAGISLAAVPVPPALWLFGSGLLGLVGVARRRQVA